MSDQQGHDGHEEGTNTWAPLPVDWELPVGWESSKDAASGLTYYFNRKTGVRQWEEPAAP